MRTLELAGRFLADVIIGVVGFCVIGLAAMLLGKFVKWLAENNVPELIIMVLTWLEYAIFIADIVGFGFLLVMSLVKLIKEVWRLS